MALPRLKRRQDFVRIASQGQHWVTPNFILQCHPYLGLQGNDADQGIRVGYVASRRVGGAVERNRAKRRLRVIVEQVLKEVGLVGFDYVLVARKVILAADFEQLLRDLKWAVKRIHTRTSKSERAESKRAESK